MIRSLLLVVLSSFVFACSAVGKTTVEPSAGKLIAIGDVHGDYDQFVKLLRHLNLINKRNKWTGGKTHLVQLGDIPDRGPDTRRIMDLLMKLEKSVRKAGGKLDVLIGNHEAMNMTNDLRYVHAGEWAAFKDKKSKARNDAYYNQTVAHLTNVLPPEELPVFDKAHRDEWNKKFPLGYVEHRIAWAPSGKYGKWVLSHDAVAKVGDTVFVHGGISEKYSSMPISEMNTRIRTDLLNENGAGPQSISEDPRGPLWYRGWTRMTETAENEAALDAVLAALGAKRMVVAHTPTLPMVLPKFGGKLLMVDVGLSKAYGGGFSALELVDGQAFALFEGGRVALPDTSGVNPTVAYLDAAAAFVENKAKVAQYKDLLLNPLPIEPAAEPAIEPAKEAVPAQSSN